MALSRAKRYSRIKYALSLADILYLIFLLFVFILSGGSKLLLEQVVYFTGPGPLALPVYLLCASLGYYLLDFPLTFYGSFLLERRFGLSGQRISGWLYDQLKSGLLSYIFSLILFAVFYRVLGALPDHWWLAASAFWIIFNLVLTRLFPVLIIPLFFKYKDLGDPELKNRIIRLAEKMRVRLVDVLEIDLSKKTFKANAAFVGTGASRRVLLADTLKDRYSAEEVEVIVAHEFAHYKSKHILKLLAADSAVTAALFYIIFRSSDWAAVYFGFGGLAELAAMPLVLLYFIIFGLITRPLENWLSRRFEVSADKQAIEATACPGAFVSMMEKLADQNLADRCPHPFIRFFFFDHPPIDERIALARKLS